MIYWLRKYFSDPEGHVQALYEVITIALFSLAPFAITYFALAAKTDETAPINWVDIVGRGQLYLLAYGVFGTVFWLAFLKSEKPRHGARALLGAIATILTLPIIGFLGVDPTFSTILNASIVNYGYWLYGLLLFINYLILFYTNITPPEPKDVLGRETSDMRQKYEELNNG